MSKQLAFKICVDASHNFNRAKVCNLLEKIYRKMKPQQRGFTFFEFDLQTSMVS